MPEQRGVEPNLRVIESEVVFAELETLLHRPA